MIDSKSVCNVRRNNVGLNGSCSEFGEEPKGAQVNQPPFLVTGWRHTYAQGRSVRPNKGSGRASTATFPVLYENASTNENLFVQKRF